MFVCVECCVLSGRGLRDGLITRPEKSCRLWCVVMCDLETWSMRRPWPALGRSATGEKMLNWCEKSPEDNLREIETCRSLIDRNLCKRIYNFNIQFLCWYYFMNCVHSSRGVMQINIVAWGKWRVGFAAFISWIVSSVLQVTDYDKAVSECTEVAHSWQWGIASWNYNEIVIDGLPQVL